MQGRSHKAVFVVLMAVLVALGISRLVRNYAAEKLPQVQLSATIGHPTLLGGAQQTTFIKVDLAGFQIRREKDRTPVNVAIVLDKSGSMSGQKMDRAIQATLMAIDRLKKGDVVSIIAYDHVVTVLLPATKVRNKRMIREQLQNIIPGGGTALHAGVLQGGLQVLRHLDRNRVNRVILISDGQANTGPSTPWELGELGAAMLEDGIAVTTIGLGLGYNEDLLTQLSLKSDGNHNFVEHVGDLTAVFDQEFGDVLSVVAQDVQVTIDCKEGIRPVRVLGREATIEGQQVKVELNQLYSEQEKYIMLEVETEPSVSGDKVEVASVELSYANMFTRDTDQLGTTVTAQITDSEQVVQESVDKEPMVAAVEQLGIINEEKAIELRDQGKMVEAEEVLRENAEFFQYNADLYGEDRLRSTAQKSLDAIDNLDGPQWNQQRKAMRADHYKGKVQQGNK